MNQVPVAVVATDWIGKFSSARSSTYKMASPSVRLIVKLAIILISLTITVDAFNLEPMLAVVKEGPPDGYFGFSVAQHEIIYDNGETESVLLVGAPRDRVSGRVRGGQLWACPFTARNNDCRPVDVDIATDPRSQDNEGQWLGAVVHSQGPGKQVITCAPRFVRHESDHRWGNGRCFTLTQSLKHSATWDPCEGREKNRAHEEWGYCQAGMSALLTPDDQALIGTPGPYTWRGSVFAISVHNDFLTRDKTHYHTPVKPGQAAVDKYAYLGMALAVGPFLPASKTCGRHKVSYAAGAPRAGGTGKVVLFVKCHSELLKVQDIIDGEEFASSFGYSLATVDLDGNGIGDLIVGAPFFHGTDFQNGGAIYVITNGPNGLKSDRVRITGQVESRFGLSLTNAGDLNQDGYQDLIVGAPYDGRGKIFVYIGREGGLSDEQKPDQVIAAEQIRGRFPSKTFGYSLDGGLDMDGNNHSDIVVGAFESDVAVIIRSRPVIDIVTWFGERPQKINPEVAGCQDDLLSSEVCFTIESCFLIKNFPPNIETTHIKYTLEAEVFPGGRRKVSRIRFGDHLSNASHVSEKVIAVKRNSLTGCFLETAYLKKETTDLTTPLSFMLSLQLQQDEPSSTMYGLTNINQYPILNQQEAKKELVLNFQKSCGGDDICNSNVMTSLEIEGHNEDLGTLEVKAKSEVTLKVLVRNAGEAAYEAFLRLDIDPSFSYVGRSDNVTDITCEYLANASISCSLGNPYDGGRSDELIFRVLPKVELEQKADTVSTEAQFSISFRTTSTDLNVGKTMKKSFDLVKRSEMSIRSSVQPQSIWFGGQTLGESAMKVMNDIGSKVTHTFQVTNDGPWHIGNFEVVIDWPYQLAVEGRENNPRDPGKWLLYLASEAEISPQGSGKCFINPRMINQLGLRENRFLNNRKRRRRRIRRRQRRDVDVDDNHLDCSRHDRMLCRQITCRFNSLRSSENIVIRFRSRVWNSTLVEEFSDFEHVVIPVTSRVVMHPERERYQNVEDDVTSVVMTAFSINSASGIEAIPLWMILLAILIGVALVIVIILTLNKLGFFKRHRHSGNSNPMDDSAALMVSGKTATRPRGSEYIS